MSRDHQSLLQKDGLDLSNVSPVMHSTITPGAQHHRMSSQGSFSTPFLREEPSWESSMRGKQGVFKQHSNLPRKPVPGNGVAAGIQRKSFSSPLGPQLPHGLQAQSMPMSSFEIPYQTPQTGSISSGPTLDPSFQKSDTYYGGGLDILREEEDISRVKTTAHFDEYELGNVGLEEPPAATNNDNENDNTSMIDVLRHCTPAIQLIG